MGWEPPSEDAFNNEWFRPQEALDGLTNICDEYARKRWIMERLKSGQMIAVARTGQPEMRSIAMRPFTPIAPSLWQKWDGDGDDHFWQTDDAIFEHYGTAGGYGSSTPQRFFDVRFDPQGFSGKLPAHAPPQAAQASQTANKGGRPAKAWWEDLWVEMCRQLYDGDLKPDKQADIEKAMHDWLASIGETASEQTIRARAHKLYKALKPEG